MSVQIEIRGLDTTIAILNTMRGFDRLVDPILEAWGQDVIANDLEGEGQYPPQLAGQRYVRTGNLGAGWSLVRSARSVRFQNAMPYAGDVVGDVQGSYFYGRWWIASQRIANRFGEVGLMLESKVQQLWDTGIVYDVNVGRFRNSSTGRFTSIGG